MESEHRCHRCGEDYRTAHRLARHSARKTPCGIIALPHEAHPHRCKQCGRTYASRGNLNKHTRVSCKPPAAAASVEAQLTEMRAHINKLEHDLAQTAAKTAVVQSIGTAVAGNIVNHVNINVSPWGSPPQLTDADVEAALASIPGIAGTMALPKVIAALMKLVKRSHLPAGARNVHLNPRRADQALALTAAGWAALPLSEATAALFDGASARIAAPGGRPRASALRTTIPLRYRADKALAVQLGLRPMEAHLANMAPGGPGPLLLEAAAGAPPSAAAGAQATALQPAAAHSAAPSHVERVKMVLKTHPVRYSPSGALLVEWIVGVTQAAGITGRELFLALEAGASELAPIWAAAQVYAAEKMLTVRCA